jgi:hypothetical protein
MESTVAGSSKRNSDPEGNGDSFPVDPSEKEAVSRELESILSSPYFCTTKRSKQFLSYVVHYKLDGHEKPLKERTIGTELFNRPAGYATGDDPVVRVQAGDVRRRLEQYYHAAPSNSPVRIELPVGFYTPEFVWTQTVPVGEVRPEAALAAVITTEQANGKRKLFRWAWVALAILIAAAAAGMLIHYAKAPRSALDRFWSPAMANSGPILLCLAKPTVYRPSADLYQAHSRPGQFDTEFDRLGAPPPLKPNDTLEWHDMVEYSDYGVASGDVHAAIRLSTMLTQLGKDSQLRIGNNYSFEDLRNSPAIVLGAFNNRWAMQITSNLHYTFVEENGHQMIREQGQRGRTWQANWIKHPSLWIPIEDYGLVTRLLDSKTGQFVVSVAGITAAGTQAASEFVSSSEDLDKGLRDAPPDWARKNLQIVVHTTVTDSIPGPPEIVATYIW